MLLCGPGTQWDPGQQLCVSACPPYTGRTYPEPFRETARSRSAG